jgi:large subunit ribosomal protein L6
MNTQEKKFKLKIPQNILVIYNKEKKILIVKGPIATKSLKLKLKITIQKIEQTLSVSPLPFYQISNAEKKKINALRATTVAQIKHLFIESSTTIFQKLKIVGVGYRIDFTNESEKKLLTLKLGYSHSFFIRVPNDLILNCFTRTKFSIFGNSYHEISKLSSKIREKKVPEPYKGKGILYETEIITLKEGKKI